MILRLDDNYNSGSSEGVRTIYNPKTGVALIIQPNQELSSKASRAARKAAK